MTDEMAIGDVVAMKDWADETLHVRIRGFFESPAHGPCIDGVEVEYTADGNMRAHRYVSLPESRIIETAVLTRAGRGKWDVTYPSGRVSRFASAKAARARVKARGMELSE